MSQMPDALVSMLWAAAIPHFFDAQVLAALRPELADEVETIYESLQALTFVEEFPGHGHNIHELTREVLLSQLWQQNRAELLLLSERAANYFFEKKASPEEDVEFCYHEILGEEENQRGRLLDRAIHWWTYYQNDRIQFAIQVCSEHEAADRLSNFGFGFLRYLKGLSKRREANYQDAEQLFMQAQEHFQSIALRDWRYLTSLLRDLSNIQLDKGDAQAARPICQQALKVSQEQLGANHPDTAISLSNLASIYQAMGQYEEAEPLALRDLKICEEQLGANHPHTATSLSNLASLYRARGRYEEAEPLVQRALKIRKEQLGANHPDTAISLNNLAGLYRARGRYEEAEPLYQRALKICEEQLGANHPDTATSLNNLAGLYQDRGRYEEAEPLYQQALKIREEQLGENHPDTASSLNNLASLYHARGRYEEAEPLFQRALKIREEQLGENHPDTANSLNNLAGLYQAIEQYEEAISLLKRWRQVKIQRQETQSQRFARRIHTLGTFYEKTQQFADATSAYEDAISIIKRELGAKHPVVRVWSGELARLKKKIKKQKKQNQ